MANEWAVIFRSQDVQQAKNWI